MPSLALRLSKKYIPRGPRNQSHQALLNDEAAMHQHHQHQSGGMPTRARTVEVPDNSRFLLKQQKRRDCISAEDEEEHVELQRGEEETVAFSVATANTVPFLCPASSCSSASTTSSPPTTSNASTNGSNKISNKSKMIHPYHARSYDKENQVLLAQQDKQDSSRPSYDHRQQLEASPARGANRPTLRTALETRRAEDRGEESYLMTPPAISTDGALPRSPSSSTSSVCSKSSITRRDQEVFYNCKELPDTRRAGLVLSKPVYSSKNHENTTVLVAGVKHHCAHDVPRALNNQGVKNLGQHSSERASVMQNNTISSKTINDDPFMTGSMKPPASFSLLPPTQVQPPFASYYQHYSGGQIPFHVANHANPVLYSTTCSSMENMHRRIDATSVQHQQATASGPAQHCSSELVPLAYIPIPNLHPHALGYTPIYDLAYYPTALAVRSSTGYAGASSHPPPHVDDHQMAQNPANAAAGIHTPMLSSGTHLVPHPHARYVIPVPSDEQRGGEVIYISNDNPHQKHYSQIFENDVRHQGHGVQDMHHDTNPNLQVDKESRKRNNYDNRDVSSSRLKNHHQDDSTSFKKPCLIDNRSQSSRHHNTMKNNNAIIEKVFLKHHGSRDAALEQKQRHKIAKKNIMASPPENFASNKILDEEKPRRPLTAYNFFFSEERERIIAEMTKKEERNSSNNSPVGSMDNDDEEDPLKSDDDTGAREDEEEDLALEEKIRAKTEKILSSRRECDRPKRSHKKEHGKVSFRVLCTLVGKRWKQLSAEQKQYYTDLSRKDVERYREDMKEYANKRAKVILSNSSNILKT